MTTQLPGAELRAGATEARFAWSASDSADGSDAFDPALRWTGAGCVPDPAAGTVVLDRLATYFGVPGLSRDLHPTSPWSGVTPVRPRPAPPAGTSDPAEFGDRLTAAVERAAGDAEHIALAASGGLDSCVLLDLVGRACRAAGRRLTVVTLDIADDTGRRTLPAVRRQVDFLRVDADLVGVDALPSRWPEPVWDPVGPRFDAWPRLHNALALAAAKAGATVLLQGNGADQLLQAPPHLAVELPRSSRARYRGDMPGDTAVTAVVRRAGRLDRPGPARLYWATQWPGLAADRGAPVLAPDRLPAVVRWLADFQDASLEPLLRSGPTWAAATILHRTFPWDRLSDAGPLREVMPFLKPDVARWCYDLPPAARYVPHLPSGYLRGKGLLAALLPDGAETVLAPRRQRCYKAYERYWRTVMRDPSLGVELGLVRPDWRRHARDSFDVAMVMACELWLRGALERGAQVAGSGP